MNETITLYGRASDGIPLAEALSECAAVLAGGIGLLYAPDQCVFTRIGSAGELEDSNDLPIDLKNVFEVKIFTETHELRWLNEKAGSGRAVLLSEQELTEPLTDPLNPLKAIETLSQTYLLWGKGIEAGSSSWGQIASARVGSLDVPIGGIQQDSYVYLHSREYLKEIDDYGNVAVVEERLIKLGVEK